MMNREDSGLKAGERLDDLQIKGYEIIQSPGRFCFGMDAVLLSSYAKIRNRELALDLGTGTGILPILLEAKNEGEHYTGLEIQEESADMARRSVSHNGLEDKIDIVTGDIKEASGIFGAASFHVITTNPPYMIGEHGLKNEKEALYIARHEALCTLDDILRESARLLKPKGRFYMVHGHFGYRRYLPRCQHMGLSPSGCGWYIPILIKSQTWCFWKDFGVEDHECRWSRHLSCIRKMENIRKN